MAAEFNPGLREVPQSAEIIQRGFASSGQADKHEEAGASGNIHEMLDGNRLLAKVRGSADAHPRPQRIEQVGWEERPLLVRRIVLFGKCSRCHRLAIVGGQRRNFLRSQRQAAQHFGQSDLEFQLLFIIRRCFWKRVLLD